MDIKKTDVFSGIGVFTIQMIANGIWYACLLYTSDAADE